jgi:hypothetical protein
MRAALRASRLSSPLKIGPQTAIVATDSVDDTSEPVRQRNKYQNQCECPETYKRWIVIWRCGFHKAPIWSQEARRF